MSAVGTVVGSYKIVSELGKGGMGVVYVAEHTLIGKKAAVKVLLPRFAASADIVQRFFNEAKAAAAIQHPGIVEVFDFGHLPDGSAYLVMELLGGESLTERLKRGPLPLPELVNVSKQTAAAVGAAHDKGIVHRDLKPDNVYLVPDEHMPFGVRVKVLDFGIAKLADDNTSPSNIQTQAGEMLGTPNYMSPEQCKGAGDVDARADVYSLGCMVYEMATGTVPFDAKGTGAVIAAHIYEEPPPPRTIDASLAPGLEKVILRALAKEAKDRPQSMDALADELDLAAQEKPAVVKPPEPAKPPEIIHARKSRTPLILAAAGVAIVLGAGVAIFSGGKDKKVAPVLVRDAAPPPPPDAAPPDAAPLPTSDPAALTKRCDAGDLPACLQLGRAYENGLGVEVDLTRAFAVYLEACDKKLADACAATASMYEDGKGVSTDTARAVALYTRACDAGSGAACAGIGTLTSLGQGVPVDGGKALAFFDKGCEKKDFLACLRAARARQLGQGVPGDAAGAKERFAAIAAEAPAACDAGDPRACHVLGIVRVQGLAGPADKIGGLDLTTRACSLGWARACSESAALRAVYGVDRGAGPRELTEAACARGDDVGCALLGKLLVDGGDPDRAIELFERACQGGGEAGCVELAGLLDVGGVVDQDQARATIMFRRACDGGSMRGCLALGVRLGAGTVARKDERRARLAAERACTLDSSACWLLARQTRDGVGGPADSAKARELFQRACTSGNEDSCRDAAPPPDAGVTPVDAAPSP